MKHEKRINAALESAADAWERLAKIHREHQRDKVFVLLTQQEALAADSAKTEAEAWESVASNLMSADWEPEPNPVEGGR